ncbi:LpxL/LpxP family Kdo(2)-lipid IV(A) lauroyl/palmitoleoyl acyltransferase [Gammaproteobacteria bacterium]|uniref:Lipid A biosynthesis acyltransferase n=1 Tax=OM182 bacterium MED-G28 TaxID=1986256 RepID=A0A2A5WE60_9GAMM|nr:LpxL/LpxP family Kdo(2)-lipid IV(A) lauroyl/palmitoleoyl acyltransferase [Gammaproteobacteria bacterium]PDH34564.1 MAG: lipid A biosynthesis acyltransferase [OM182 bacterium MED-G28]|tara:strand:+ start:710 stop:1645 length:936 start_codon:yes stop_codon:yes gene_type:complete
MSEPELHPEYRPMSQYLAPRYWPTWMGLGLMWAVARLPFAIQIKVGQLLGVITYFLALERKHICEVNLRLCFPELNEKALNQLVRKTFISNAIGLIEIAIAWHREPEEFRDRVTVSGLENLETAVAKRKGVLLLCAHFTTLEFGGFLFNLNGRMDVTYRPNNNLLFDAAMYNGRIRHHPAVLDRKDIRGAMRGLKQGHILWYAPDQDYGAKHSVFVPFFGNQAATITATSRFAAFNDSEVVFYSHYRNADNSGYHLDFSPALKNYPTGDKERDAIIINKIIEEAIRKKPDQYLWLHKRFKTQEAGKSARPY